jgi:hypothetical protein
LVTGYLSIPKAAFSPDAQRYVRSLLYTLLNRLVKRILKMADDGQLVLVRPLKASDLLTILIRSFQDAKSLCRIDEKTAFPWSELTRVAVLQCN